MISLIAAIGKNNELGKKNALLWNLPADMKHFREITAGHTVIMGQKTFESIGRPLPNRRNIVLTQEDTFNPPGVEISRSFEDTLATFKNSTEEVFIIGGGMIYKLFIDHADKLYITHVVAEFPDADTFFPFIDLSKWGKVKSTSFPRDFLNQYDLEFAEYTKILS